MVFDSEMSKRVFESKYMLESDKSSSDAVERVVSVVRKYYPEIEKEIREAIVNKWIGVAGGLWRSAMNPNKNVSCINCTTLDQPEDNLESISEGWYWWAKFAAFGQGEGIDLSKLRPKGSKVHNSARKSTGAVSFMHTFDAVLKIIAQQGRRGASLISLNIRHPDIPDFITIKDEPGVLESANISIQVTDDFMGAVAKGADWTFKFKSDYEEVTKTVNAADLFKFLAEHAWKSGDPGIQYIDTVRHFSNSDYLGVPVVSTNACSFVGDTLVITKEGIFPIEDLVGKEVTIFDGNEWVKNSTFKVTGYNQDIYRVTLHNGVYFDVTEQHRFFTEEGGEKRTYELNPGDNLEYDLGQAEFEGTEREDGAYLKGFLLGDGNIHDEGFSNGPRPQLWLYGPKYCCFHRIKSSFEEMAQSHNAKNLSTVCELKEYPSSDRCSRGSVTGLTSVERDTLYKWCNEYKHRLPREVFNWDNQSKLNLIAGLFDADGTSLNSDKGYGYQLPSIHKDFLVDIVRLLSTVGVYGRIAQLKEKGTSVIRGVEYDAKPLYRLTIPQKDAIQLSKKVSFERLLDFSGRDVKRATPFRYNRVVSIDKLEQKAEKVYCTHVNSTSKFMVNSGIITGNSEQWLDAHNTCILSSINLSKFHEFGKGSYQRLIHVGIMMLDAFRQYELDEGRSPSEQQKQKLVDLPRIGLGVTGLADYFIDKGIRYASPASIEEARWIFGTLAGESYKASYLIAKRYGCSFPLYDKKKYKKSPFVRRLIREGWVEEKHLEYQAHVCKTTVAPNGTLTEMVEAGGGGIEPLFAKYFVRRERSTTGDWKEWFTYNHAVRNLLNKEGVELTKDNVDRLTDGDVWVTAHDVNNYDKIRLMAEIQKYIDSAISVTYNLPETATPEDIENIYMEAWKHKLKAVSVFREGCKPGVLITDANYEKTKKSELLSKVEQNRFSPERPEYVQSDVYDIRVNKEPHIVIVGIIEGKPYEVFVTSNVDRRIDTENHKHGVVHKRKKGKYDLIVENGDTKVIIDDINSKFDSTYNTLSRFISMSLRHDVPLPFIVDQLAKDKNFSGFEKSVSRILKKYIADETKVPTSENCPSCDASTLIYKEGCKTCISCGWSKCD